MCRKGRFHFVSVGFARMPSLISIALRISSLPLLMRNPGLTHIAHENIRNVPCGPLSLRSSGICPDAFAQGQRTAHQFASLLMRNPGLTGRFHFVPAGFARMPS